MVLHYCNTPIYKHYNILIFSKYAPLLTLSIPVYFLIITNN